MNLTTTEEFRNEDMLAEEAAFSIPEEFFKEEERCGFTVTEKMKKVWAVEMEMLHELERVCEKYGLTYFADSGTLLGAIRHKGYIPWDDDIDIVMLRDDYDKLLEVGPEEFKAPLFFQSAYTDNHYVRAVSRIRNSQTTAIGKKDIGRSFNRGIFIDIFPVDRIPDNLFVRKMWIRRIKFIRQLLRNWAYDEGKKGNAFEKTYRAVLRGLVGVIGYKKVYRHFQNVCAKYRNKDTKKVTYVGYSLGKAKHIWERSDFDGVERVPFEFTEINIPAGYDERLRVEYGDYMTPVKASSTHGELILEPEIPFAEYVKTHDVKEELHKIGAI